MNLWTNKRTPQIQEQENFLRLQGRHRILHIHILTDRLSIKRYKKGTKFPSDPYAGRKTPCAVSHNPTDTHVNRQTAKDPHTDKQASSDPERDRQTPTIHTQAERHPQIHAQIDSHRQTVKLPRIQTQTPYRSTHKQTEPLQIHPQTNRSPTDPPTDRHTPAQSTIQTNNLPQIDPHVNRLQPNPAQNIPPQIHCLREA